MSSMLGESMMANQNTFLCDCGRVLGRPLAHRHPRGATADGEELMMGLPWDFELGDPVHRGVTCGKCRAEWTWMMPAAGAAYVNVQKVAE